jgi:hypothetical protein
LWSLQDRESIVVLDLRACVRVPPLALFKQRTSFEDGHGSADARPVKGDRDASRDELVKAVTDAMQGDYLDGQITVFRDGKPADTITATRGLAS